jgi:hypothetical protein
MLPSQCQCVRFLTPCSNAAKQALPRKTFTETRPPRRVNAAYIWRETEGHPYGRCLLRHVHLQQDRRRIVLGSLRGRLSSRRALMGSTAQFWPHALSRHGRTRPCLSHKIVQSSCTVTARTPFSTTMLISAVAQCAPHLLLAFTPSAAASCAKSSRTRSYLPSCAAQCTAVRLQHIMVIGAAGTRQAGRGTTPTMVPCGALQLDVGATQQQQLRHLKVPIL